MFCRSTFRFPARFGLGCFGCDQAVGLANEGFEFICGQDVGVGEHHPLVASDVGRGGDAFDLQQFVEYVSGAHLRVMRGNRPSERTMPVKILPRTLKQRSSPHGMSSVTSGKERQSLRIHSTSGMGDDSARVHSIYKQVHAGKSAHATRATPDLSLRPALPVLPVVSCLGRWLPSRCRRRGVCS
jgi:hypothetical protein